PFAYTSATPPIPDWLPDKGRAVQPGKGGDCYEYANWSKCHYWTLHHGQDGAGETLDTRRRDHQKGWQRQITPEPTFWGGARAYPLASLFVYVIRTEKESP